MTGFRNILFPIDFSARSHAAAPFVLSMARTFDAKVTLLHAFPALLPYWSSLDIMPPAGYDLEQVRRDLRDRLAEFAASELPKCEIAVAAESGDPAALIIEETGFLDSPLIALPTHGYGAFRRALLGSVTAKVLHDAEVPVWTSAHVPEPTHRAHPKPRRILAAVDLRNGSAPTLDFALGLARESDASVEILHVAPPGEPGPVDHGARLHELLTGVSRDHEIPIIESEEAEAEIASAPAGIAATIRSLAIRKRIDLVVIGRGCIRSTGPGRFNSHAYSIIREAPCPVLSV